MDAVFLLLLVLLYLLTHGLVYALLKLERHR